MESYQNHLSSDALNQPWNVFLSFRGDDTRKNFTGHLYMALKQAGIKAFMDDSGLQTGEDIPDQLLNAIRGSEISLVIFSSNYASSSWCLKELVEILECKHRMGQLVYPVFYNVSPSVVRNRSESFAAAFEMHEKRYVSNMEKVDRWKAALTEAANLSGYDLQKDADGYEVRLIQIIVQKVLLEVNLVGLHVAKVFRSFGWMLPAIISSLLITSGPKAFLMALAVPMGQSALSLLFQRIVGKKSSKPKRKARTRRRPRARSARNVKSEEDEEETDEDSRKDSMGYQTWVGGNDVRADRDGGWDDLDRQSKTYKGSEKNSAQNTDSPQRRKLSGGGRKGETPLLLRLLIAVFPFLGSWTRML